MRRLVIAMACAASMVFAGSAHAAILFDSGVPTICGCTSLDKNQWLGADLDFSSPVTITGVEGFVTVAVSGSVNVAIYSVTDFLPDTPIFSTSVNFPATSGSWLGDVALNVPLAAGRYWLGFTIDPSSSLNAYMLSYPPVATLVPFRDVPAAEWRLAGQPIGWRISGEGAPAIPVIFPDASIPEPRMWAMLLLGFGLIGGALRVRRKALGLSLTPNPATASPPAS